MSSSMRNPVEIRDRGLIRSIILGTGVAVIYAYMGKHPRRFRAHKKTDSSDLVRLFSIHNGGLLEDDGLLEPIIDELLEYIDVMGKIRMPNPGVTHRVQTPYRELQYFPHCKETLEWILLQSFEPGVKWCAIASFLCFLSAKENVSNDVKNLVLEAAETHPIAPNVSQLDFDSAFGYLFPTFPLCPSIRAGGPNFPFIREACLMMNSLVAFFNGENGKTAPNAFDQKLPLSSLLGFSPEMREEIRTLVIDWTSYLWDGANNNKHLPVSGLSVAPMAIEDALIVFQNILEHDPIEVGEFLESRLRKGIRPAKLTDKVVLSTVVERIATASEQEQLVALANKIVDKVDIFNPSNISWMLFNSFPVYKAFLEWDEKDFEALLKDLPEVLPAEGDHYNQLYAYKRFTGPEIKEVLELYRETKLPLSLLMHMEGLDVLSPDDEL